MSEAEQILEPSERRRYADAIVKAALSVGPGDTLVIQAEPAHRELAVETVAAGYRAGATIVELQYYDPLVTRARLLNGRDEAIGAIAPWSKRRLNELAKPYGARAAIIGDSEPGYLDGIPPKKIALDISRTAEQTKAFRRANLDMRARWTGAGWPTDYWAGQVYPDLSPLEGKRRLAQDILWFCRLTDDDGTGSTGWLKHARALARRAAKLTKLELRGLELRGPGTSLDVGLAPNTRWLGGQEETPDGAKITPNVPTEETFTSPDAAATEGTFTCTFPLSFQGRMIDGLRGEFRGGKLVRLDASNRMPQTEESIHILKDSKTPFIVAVNKIDRIQGWHPGRCFLDNFDKQSDEVKGEFEKMFYELVAQFNKFEISVERFDRVTDFRTTVAVVPISAKTGEGLPDLLTTLVGLAQNYMKDQLVKTDEAAGMILEVKDVIGLGKVMDCIIYDGTVHKNDHLIIGGRSPMITKIRSLMMPEPLRDIRTEKKFRVVDECHAACGVRISAPGLDNVLAGSAIKSAKTLEEAEKLYEQWEKEKEVVEIHHDSEGLILKSSTVGGLDALISIFKAHSIREAEIGQITKKDVMSAEANRDVFHRIVIGFNTDVGEDADTFAKDKDIRILTSDVIYRLIEGYNKWVDEERQEIKKKEVDALIRPGKMHIMPGLVFRASNPAIVGCEVVAGIIKPGYNLFKIVGNELHAVGEIKQIQSQGQNVSEVKINDKVAVSIMGPTVGRQIDEGDILYTDMNSDNYKKLIKNEKFLTEHEKQVLEEIFILKKKVDPRFGL